MMTEWLTYQNNGELKKKKKNPTAEINYNKHKISVDKSSPAAGILFLSKKDNETV
jgi:hypothetical protein